MSRTEKLRRFARRLNVENARLTELSADLHAAGFPMIAGDIYEAAFKCGALSFSLNHVADQVRDRRGATAGKESAPVCRHTLNQNTTLTGVMPHLVCSVCKQPWPAQGERDE